MSHDSIPAPKPPEKHLEVVPEPPRPPAARPTASSLQFLNRHQWPPFVLLALALLSFFVYPALVWPLIASAAILAGMYPLLTAFYRGPFGILTGWKARARGLVSIAIGVAVLTLF